MKFSSLKREEEVLLPMGSRFFVKAILQPNEGLTMIELEEAL
jgi:hypothetical protein